MSNQDQDQPQNPTVNKGTAVRGTLPNDATLKSQGHTVGDLKFVSNDGTSYQISPMGSAAPAGFRAAGTIA